MISRRLTLATSSQRPDSNTTSPIKPLRLGRPVPKQSHSWWAALSRTFFQHLITATISAVCIQPHQRMNIIISMMFAYKFAYKNTIYGSILAHHLLSPHCRPPDCWCQQRCLISRSDTSSQLLCVRLSENICRPISKHSVKAWAIILLWTETWLLHDNQQRWDRLSTCLLIVCAWL